jgi:hypothetical protein
MGLASKKDMTFASEEGDIRGSAKKRILLESGGGFIEIKDGNVTIGGPGKLFVKMETIEKEGPVSMGPSLPSLPQSEFVEKYSLRFATFGADSCMQDIGWVGKSFKILDSKSNVLQSGSIPENGHLPRTMLDTPDELTLHVGSEDWEMQQLETGDDTSSSEMEELPDGDNPWLVEDDDSEFIDDAEVAKLVPADILAQVNYGAE